MNKPVRILPSLVEAPVKEEVNRHTNRETSGSDLHRKIRQGRSCRLSSGAQVPVNLWVECELRNRKWQQVGVGAEPSRQKGDSRNVTGAQGAPGLGRYRVEVRWAR